MRDRELIPVLMLIATAFWIIILPLAACFCIDLSNLDIRGRAPGDTDEHNKNVVSLFWFHTAVYAMVMIFLLIGLAMNKEPGSSGGFAGDDPGAKWQATTQRTFTFRRRRPIIVAAGITDAESERRSTKPKRLRFGISSLLVLTTALSGYCALGRCLGWPRWWPVVLLIAIYVPIYLYAWRWTVEDAPQDLVPLIHTALGCLFLFGLCFYPAFVLWIAGGFRVYSGLI